MVRIKVPVVAEKAKKLKTNFLVEVSLKGWEVLKRFHSY